MLFQDIKLTNQAKQQDYWNKVGPFLKALQAVEEKVAAAWGYEHFIEVVRNLPGISLLSKDEWDHLKEQVRRVISRQQQRTGEGRVYELGCSSRNLLMAVLCYGTVDPVTGAPMSKSDISVDA